MRDAVGGTFMIRVFLIFLATYIIFIAIALNYAKAFRVKNKILDIIEQNEGINSFYDTGDVALTQINNYMGNINYKISNNKMGITEDECKEAFKTDSDNNLYFNNGRGYCIRKIDNLGVNNGIKTEYYQVATFVDIYIPLVELHHLIPIKGETRKIERKIS